MGSQESSLFHSLPPVGLKISPAIPNVLVKVKLWQVQHKINIEICVTLFVKLVTL